MDNARKSLMNITNRSLIDQEPHVLHTSANLKGLESSSDKEANQENILPNNTPENQSSSIMIPNRLNPYASKNTPAAKDYSKKQAKSPPLSSSTFKTSTNSKSIEKPLTDPRNMMRSNSRIISGSRNVLIMLRNGEMNCISEAVEKPEPINDVVKPIKIAKRINAVEPIGAPESTDIAKPKKAPNVLTISAVVKIVDIIQKAEPLRAGELLQNLIDEHNRTTQSSNVRPELMKIWEPISGIALSIGELEMALGLVKLSESTKKLKHLTGRENLDGPTEKLETNQEAKTITTSPPRPEPLSIPAPPEKWLGRKATSEAAQKTRPLTTAENIIKSTSPANDFEELNQREPLVHSVPKKKSLKVSECVDKSKEAIKSKLTKTSLLNTLKINIAKSPRKSTSPTSSSSKLRRLWTSPASDKSVEVSRTIDNLISKVPPSTGIRSTSPTSDNLNSKTSSSKGIRFSKSPTSDTLISKSSSSKGIRLSLPPAWDYLISKSSSSKGTRLSTSPESDQPVETSRLTDNLISKASSSKGIRLSTSPTSDNIISKASSSKGIRFSKSPTSDTLISKSPSSKGIRLSASPESDQPVETSRPTDNLISKASSSKEIGLSTSPVSDNLISKSSSSKGIRLSTSPTSDYLISKASSSKGIRLSASPTSDYLISKSSSSKRISLSTSPESDQPTESSSSTSDFENFKGGYNFSKTAAMPVTMTVEEQASSKKVNLKSSPLRCFPMLSNASNSIEVNTYPVDNAPISYSVIKNKNVDYFVDEFLDQRSDPNQSFKQYGLPRVIAGLRKRPRKIPVPTPRSLVEQSSKPCPSDDRRIAYSATYKKQHDDELNLSPAAKFFGSRITNSSKDGYLKRKTMRRIIRNADIFNSKRKSTSLEKVVPVSSKSRSNRNIVMKIVEIFDDKASQKSRRNSYAPKETRESSKQELLKGNGTEVADNRTFVFDDIYVTDDSIAESMSISFKSDASERDLELGRELSPLRNNNSIPLIST